jgi:ferric iron reductase protein FhuF
MAQEGPASSRALRDVQGDCRVGRSPDETDQVTEGGQALVAGRVPGAAALGLVAPPSTDVVPATLLADASWTAEMLAARTARQGTGDRRVLATVWWYSASTVLLTPSLAGLVTGIPLSARLADTSLSMLAGGQPVAAVASAAGTDLAGELRTTLAAVVAAVAEAGRMRERPLWAIATDSLANRLLALGRALGDVPRATALAAPLAAAVGAPLPVPRYVDVDGARFTRRASCCLLYRMPHEAMCTSCPRRPPAERQILLEDAAIRSGA